MARIAIDMDEVIADFISEQLKRFNKIYNFNLTKNDIDGFKLQKMFPELALEIDELVNQDDFFRNLSVIPHSQKVIKKLSKKNEIFIASAAMDHSRSLDAKLYWLNQHFPFISNSNVVFCGDKSIVNADFLIDDHCQHFEGFDGEGILFTSQHNTLIEGYVRVNDWLEAELHFKKLKLL